MVSTSPSLLLTACTYSLVLSSPMVQTAVAGSKLPAVALWLWTSPAGSPVIFTSAAGASSGPLFTTTMVNARWPDGISMLASPSRTPNSAIGPTWKM